MGVAETIIAADFALSRLISLLFSLLSAAQKKTVEEEIAAADIGDGRRKSIMDKIRAH
jgi:hypothetical protein